MATGTTERITYGNLRPPRRPGLKGAGLAGSVFAGIAAIIVVIVLMTLGIVAALVVAAVAIVALIPLVVHGPDGRSGYLRVGSRVAQRRGDATDRNAYLAGTAGQTPDGQCRLPGVLAASEMIEATDAFGTPFGMMHLPGVDHFSIVVRAEATGKELVDQAAVDQAVAHHGGFLARLGDEPDLVGASVTVETAPDPGTKLARMVRRHQQDDAPEFAAATLAEITRTYPAAASTINTWVALTFAARPRSGEPKRSVDAMVAELGRRIPGFLSGLKGTGAGTTVRMMTAADLTDMVRVAYDPSVAQLVEEQRSDGGTGLSWTEAGPAFAHARADRFDHDGAHSVVWQMQTPPGGVFYDDTLKALLSPHPDISRKRVTLLYRPESAESAGRIVERDVRDATMAASSRSRTTSSETMAVRAARKSADEQAQGAGVVRVGMIITATVTDLTMLPRAISTISTLRSLAKLRIRLARNNQAAAFAAGLPLGLVLPAHLALPEYLRDTL